jgi:NAD(P)-dependent dehydrogenase (short-subunit alcohol dehydrogenase family)
VRVALVTGGARGIGRACAERLAGDGYHVVIADRAGEREAAAAIDGAAAEHVELADSGEVQRLAGRVLERWDRCDALVNNAAHLGRREFAALDLETWRRFHAVNVEAPFLLCSALLPAMIAQGGGRIVNVISNTVWSPPAVGLVAYVTTKGALLGFTRALAAEVGRHGVTVNAVAPGLTATPGSSDTPPAHFAEVRAQQALDRVLAPADIAGAVAYLVSDDAAAVTGQALRIDGGLVTL